MITGFNTDIKHGDRVFHVQTEDRGLGNPVVESLVYVGGEILLSKKSSYKEQIQSSHVDEKIVKEMMDLQHRKIIEAIRRGRFDGVKPGEVAAEDVPSSGPQVSPAAAAATAAMLSGKSGGFEAIRTPAPPRPPAAAKTKATEPARTQPAPQPAPPPPPAPVPTRPAPAPVAAAPAPAPAARPASGNFPRTSPLSLPKPVSASSIPAVAPASAPRASTGQVAGERSLDQVIIEYLASEAASEHLELSLMSGGELVEGDSVSLTVRACTSLTEKPVAGAHVSIRVVSTAGPPQILFRGVTGSDGLVKTTCTIPSLGPASAALIIAASSSLGNNEIKQLVKKTR